MMSTHLAAIDSVFLAHTLLDERVAGFALDGLPAHGLADCDSVPGEARIVNDRGAGMLLQKALRQQPDDIIALNEGTTFIKKEASIKITIPGNCQIGAALLNGINSGLAILFQQWIRHTIR